MNRCIHNIISSYLAFDPVASPDRTLARDGNYNVDFIRHRMTFRLRCLSRKVQLAGLCAVLRMAGAARNASKVCNRQPYSALSSVATLLTAKSRQK